MTLLALISLALSVACFSIRESYYHGKLKWSKENKPYGFWGKHSDKRKYKRDSVQPYVFFSHPKNWYYKLTGLAYKERFPLSGSLLIWTTDGPHFLQAIMFLLLSLAFTFALGFTWTLFGITYALIHIVHFSRRILQR